MSATSSNPVLAAVQSADRLVRLHFLPFTWMLILLGASSAGTVTATEIAFLLAIALCFHVYAYVLNDVIDLPVDRTQPSRADDPLVRGSIRPWQALAFALTQVPLAMLLILAMGGDGARPAAASLFAGFVLMGVYDLWGKKCPVPPLTDLAQGLGWASLVLCGALLLGTPSALTWVAFLYGAGFILLINGVHGGLRDLAGDLGSGCRTSAIFFGCRPLSEGKADGGTHVTWGLRIFASSVQAGLVAVSLVPLVRNDFGYGKATLAAISAVVVLLNAASLWNLRLVFHPNRPGWGFAFRFHLFLLLLTCVVLFLPALQPLVAVVLLSGFFAPTLLLETTHQVLAFFRGEEFSRILETPSRPRETG